MAKEHLPNHLGNDTEQLQNTLLQFHIPEYSIFNAHLPMCLATAVFSPSYQCQQQGDPRAFKQTFALV